MEKYDVVVVGAGPVGLLTSIELVLGGVSVLVAERLATPSMVLKAGGIGPLGVEALQRRGMAPAISAAERSTFAALEKSAQESDLRTRGVEHNRAKYSGHFGGLILIRTDAQKEPERRSSRIDQQAIEAMLAVRVQALGIEVRRACEITGFTQQADGIEAELTSATSKGSHLSAHSGQVRCSYLVGCDGGRSSVRKMAGFGFPGCDPTMTMYQAVAEIDHPERLLPGGFRYTPHGMFFFFFDRLAMLDFSGPPQDREAPVTHEEIEGVLRRISSADVRIKTFENASRWTDNTRLADAYRQGRVLLAGDAAHIHSPFGGQGLSLGLADAANLGWKLAAVLRGEMPESLLDTYTAERRPVAEAVLANTLAQMAIMRPDPQSGAMRDIVAKLMQFDDANRLFGEMISGLSTRYDLGSDRDDVGLLIGDRPIGGGLQLYDIMQDGLGVLLDASTEGRASKLVAATTQRIRCVAVETGPSMLIRPDACVAWAAEGNNLDGLEDALHRWFIPAFDEAPMAQFKQ